MSVAPSENETGSTEKPQAGETAEDSPASDWALRLSDVQGDAADPLLGCLTYLTRHFDKPHSIDSLTSGLPLVESRLTPALFVRAADRADLSARIIRRKLKRIPRLVMPVVLLLKDKSACILTGWIDRDVAEIILPETGMGMRKISRQELMSIYSGYAIFTRPAFHFRRQDEAALKPSGGSWFWGTLASFWGTYLQVGLAAFLVNCFAIASPLFIMNVYDRVVPNEAFQTLWVLAIGIGTVYVFDFLLRNLRAYFVDNAGWRADVLMSSRLLEQVLNIKLKARPDSAGAFAHHLREFETVRTFFTSATLVALVDLPFIVLFIFVIWRIGGEVALVPAAAVPIVIITGLLIQIPLRRAVKQNAIDTSLKHGILVEAVSALETIKSLGAEGHVQREWERFVGSTASVSQRVRRLAGLAIHIATFVQQMVTVGVIVFGVYLIAKGNMTMGGLVACTILAGRTMAPLGQIAAILSRMHQSMNALGDLNSIMALPVERPAGHHFLSRPEIKGNIKFEDVHFTYPGGLVPALRGVSLEIQPGEKIGVIGPMASGKSTLANLLLNLYEPDEGAVLLDGTDLRQIDPADNRRIIGAVMQEPVLFKGTVQENIALGSPHADDQMILEASKLAGAHTFVSHHPQGYDMMIGERGRNLSGGQRQAIALARALLKDPRILILDEPTSSMDLRNEREFVHRLKEVIGDKTLFVITHRPSLLALVDRVIVLGEGRVLADGPRDKILALGLTSGVARKPAQASPPPQGTTRTADAGKNPQQGVFRTVRARAKPMSPKKTSKPAS